MLADTPTVGDFVPGFEASGWAGVGGPKNAPIDIVDNLNREINADPNIKARLADLGVTVLFRVIHRLRSSPKKPSSGPR